MTLEADAPLQRVLSLQGASNFRDLGGYPAQGARRVRWRRLFRSDHLGHLSAGDWEQLRRLELRCCFDFRSAPERSAMPVEAQGGLQLRPLGVESAFGLQVYRELTSGRPLSASQAAGLMCDLYRELIDGAAPRWAELFEHLLEVDGPVVFHCTSGKDRTGVAAALVLLALGVAPSRVMEDFLLTNDCYRRPAWASDTLQPHVLDALWKVQPGYLQAALQAIDDEHGGLDQYLADRLRLGPAARRALAERYLEPVPGASSGT